MAIPLAALSSLAASAKCKPVGFRGFFWEFCIAQRLMFGRGHGSVVLFGRNVAADTKPMHRRRTTTTKKTTAKKTATKVKTTKPAAKSAKAKTESKPKRLSALEAAAKILADAKEPMNTREMIEAMAKKGLWKSPGGATPWATLYSALSREINAKGRDARFKKVERGQFVFNG
jgi:HB1, ASXL, restriction endonuclease HTH domain